MGWEGMGRHGKAWEGMRGWESWDGDGMVPSWYQQVREHSAPTPGTSKSENITGHRTGARGRVEAEYHIDIYDMIALAVLFLLLHLRTPAPQHGIILIRKNRSLNKQRKRKTENGAEHE